MFYHHLDQFTAADMEFGSCHSLVDPRLTLPDYPTRCSSPPPMLFQHTNPTRPDIICKIPLLQKCLLFAQKLSDGTSSDGLRQVILLSHTNSAFRETIVDYNTLTAILARHLKLMEEEQKRLEEQDRFRLRMLAVDGNPSIIFKLFEKACYFEHLSWCVPLILDATIFVGNADLLYKSCRSSFPIADALSNGRFDVVQIFVDKFHPMFKRFLGLPNDSNPNIFEVAMRSPQINVELFGRILDLYRDHCQNFKHQLWNKTDARGQPRYNCLMTAIAANLDRPCLRLLLETYFQEFRDSKEGLQICLSTNEANIVSVAVSHDCPVHSLNIILRFFFDHGEEKLINELYVPDDGGKKNCFILAAKHQLNTDSFRLLVSVLKSRAPSAHSFTQLLRGKFLNRHNALMIACSNGMNSPDFLDNLKNTLSVYEQEDSTTPPLIKEVLEEPILTLTRNGEEYVGNCITLFLSEARHFSQVHLDAFELLVRDYCMKYADLQKVLSAGDGFDQRNVLEILFARLRDAGAKPTGRTSAEILCRMIDFLFDVVDESGKNNPSSSIFFDAFLSKTTEGNDSSLNIIAKAIQCKLPFTHFKRLFEHCSSDQVFLKQLLFQVFARPHRTSKTQSNNCLLLALESEVSLDVFDLLLQHYVKLKSTSSCCPFMIPPNNENDGHDNTTKTNVLIECLQLRCSSPEVHIQYFSKMLDAVEEIDSNNNNDSSGVTIMEKLFSCDDAAQQERAHHHCLASLLQCSAFANTDDIGIAVFKRVLDLFTKYNALHRNNSDERSSLLAPISGVHLVNLLFGCRFALLDENPELIRQILDSAAVVHHHNHCVSALSKKDKDDGQPRCSSYSLSPPPLKGLTLSQFDDQGGAASEVISSSTSLFLSSFRPDGETSCLMQAASLQVSAVQTEQLLAYIVKLDNDCSNDDNNDNTSNNTIIQHLVDYRSPTKNFSCLAVALHHNLCFEALHVLLKYCTRYSSDFTQKLLLGEPAVKTWNVLKIGMHNLRSLVSLQLFVAFIPSQEVFDEMVDVAEVLKKRRSAFDYPFCPDSHRSLIEDPQCWRKCREWLQEREKETLSEEQ